MLKHLFATHPIEAAPHVDAGEHIDTGAHGDGLKRVLTAKHLIMLGVGAVIGAGIFVITRPIAAPISPSDLVASAFEG